MNILFTRFPLESAHGGAENQTLWLAAGFAEHRHSISFLGSCPVLLEEFRKENHEATELSIGIPPVTKFGAISFLWRKNAMKKKLEKATENKKIDAVFMLSLSEKVLLTETLAKKGVKVFWVEHDRIGSWLTRNPSLPALKKAAAHATIICVSELSRKKYIQLGFDEKKVVAIPNGVPGAVAVKRPHPPAPSPEGGRGEPQEKERIFKKPLNKSILKFARDMRKEPTKAEEVLWQVLRDSQLGVKFRRQHPIRFKILDFYCDEYKLGVEVDGTVHDDKQQKLYDQERDEFLSDAGVRVIRFSNNEVVENLEDVLHRIEDALTHSSPLLSGEGLGVRGMLNVGCIARLSPEKGVDVLLAALADVPEANLTIVGSGSQEGYLHALIAEDLKRTGVTRIHILKKVEDLDAFFSTVDVFVLPSSDHDPFGLVAAEAMMRSVPTIVTDACGISSYVKNGDDALVVPAGSSVEIAKALKEFLKPELRKQIGKRGELTTLKLFSLPRMVEQYEALMK